MKKGVKLRFPTFFTQKHHSKYETHKKSKQMEKFDSENHFFKRKRNAQSESSVLLRRNKKWARTKSAADSSEGLGSPDGTPSIIVTAPNRLYIPSTHSNHGYRMSNSSSFRGVNACPLCPLEIAYFGYFWAFLGFLGFFRVLGFLGSPP